MTANVAIPVSIGGELVIRISDLPVQAFEQIKAGLTFPNEDKIKKLEEKIWGAWDLPDTIALYRVERRRGGDEVICLPRGFSMHLTAGLAGMGLAPVWEDHRTSAPAAPGYFRLFEMRDYQLEAAAELLKAEQGFYKCPAGAGKTVTALGAMAYANQRSLVIVDKADLVDQWRARAATFFGWNGSLDEPILTAGKIGQGIWEERDLTICLRQTLYERLWQLDATRWWASWGAVWFDEGHHLSADTLGELARKVTARYMFGISATPAASEIKGRIVHALVGPIVAETPRQVLYDRGVLIRPHVELVYSDVEEAFWVTHDSDADGKCQVEGCPKAAQGKRHQHRNNYSSVLKKLVESKARNALIAERIVSDRGHVHLVPSSQKKHLDLICKALIAAGWPEDKIWYLRGEENARGESQEIIKEILASDEAVILSTIAKEALDIPPIDRVHIVFPVKGDLPVVQICGRGERISPETGKADSVIVDYVDPKTWVFDNQAIERRRIYAMQGYDIREPQPQVEPQPRPEVQVG